MPSSSLKAITSIPNGSLRSARACTVATPISHAQHAVIFAGVRNGIKMRADHEHKGSSGRVASKYPDQVSGRVEMDGNPGGAHPAAQELMQPVHRLAEKCHVILPGSSVNEDT